MNAGDMLAQELSITSPISARFDDLEVNQKECLRHLSRVIGLLEKLVRAAEEKMPTTVLAERDKLISGLRNELHESEAVAEKMRDLMKNQWPDLFECDSCVERY